MLPFTVADSGKTAHWSRLRVTCAAPYGVTVRWGAVRQGKRGVVSVFARLTILRNGLRSAGAGLPRTASVLVTGNAAGELVFSRAASAGHLMRLILGKNLLTVDFDEDFREPVQRIHCRRVYARANVSLTGDGDIDAESIVARKGTATPTVDVTRYRPMIIIADSVKLRRRMHRPAPLREQRRRLAKSITFEAEIDGWTRRDGQLWMPNLLVTIDASKYAIKTTELLVSKVTLILNGQDGLSTRVSLAPREGFLVPAESDRKSRGDGNDGVDALVEDYYRRHLEKTPPWKE
ncbi:baseplate protein [Escherichia coli]